MTSPSRPEQPEQPRTYVQGRLDQAKRDFDAYMGSASHYFMEWLSEEIRQIEAQAAAPEQDEAVRLLREGNPGNNAQGDSICWCACGCVRRRPPHWDRCTRCSQGEHLATPPPVPAPLPDGDGGRWSRGGWHYIECWRAWVSDPDNRECVCDRLRQAAATVACADHDTDGPPDDASGFPTCSKCAAILTGPVLDEAYAVIDEIYARLSHQSEDA